MVTFTEFTVKEVFEAIAKNGFTHLRKDWTAEDMQGIIYGGCVLQQGGMNLGVAVTRETDAAETDSTLVRQLDQFPCISPKWQTSGGGGSVADTIIQWNDKGMWSEDDEKFIYELPTYQDVVNMAHDVLEPYFDKVIRLENRAWNINKYPIYEAIVHRAQKEMRKNNITEDVIKEFTFQAMSGILYDDAFDYLKEVLERYFDVTT